MILNLNGHQNHLLKHRFTGAIQSSSVLSYLFLLLFFFSEVQRNLRKEATPLSCRALITSHSRLICVPGVCALLHFELLFIKFSKDAEGGTPVSLRHSLCVSASFPLFSVPRQPQGPPPGEIMGRNTGRYWQETVRGQNWNQVEPL